jgi:hypothetical protein
LTLKSQRWCVLPRRQATSNQSDVVDGTFCFRPHYKMRLFAKQPVTCNVNTANLTTLGGVAIEFLLLSFYCLPKCQLNPSKCDLRTWRVAAASDPGPRLAITAPLSCSGNFQLPPENLMRTFFKIQWRHYFWFIFALISANGLVFLTHGVLTGKKKFKMANMFWIWQLGTRKSRHTATPCAGTPQLSRHRLACPPPSLADQRPGVPVGGDDAVPVLQLHYGAAR